MSERTDIAATWVPIDDLTPWAKNPRKNDHAVEQVAKSIERFGFASPIIARRADGVVIGGHTRLKAAKLLGMDKVPVRYLDLDPDQAAALAIADNKLGEIADWDSDALSDVLRELELAQVDMDGIGFTDEELAELLSDTPQPVEPGESDDDAPDVDTDAPADSQPGQVYELGPHRLLCGDSTDTASWDALLLAGDQPRATWTDPPYGVAYVGKTAEALTIENDRLDPAALEAFLRASLGLAVGAMHPGGCIYVAAPPGPLFLPFAKVMTELECWRQTLTWVKDQFVLGRSDYHYRTEAIFYGWKPGAAHFVDDNRAIDSVIEVPRPRRSTEHPTMKPVELITRTLGRNVKPGWVVIEPFGGSGSTLIACALLGCHARLIELSPHYCDAIRKRWTKWARERGIDPGPGALEPATEL